jgi:hypothetical protein
MFWLRKPPYLRWAAAAAIVAAALVWDLHGRATTPFPFAGRDLDAGQRIEEGDVEWRDLPAGAFTIPDLAGRMAAVAIGRGEPLIAPVLALDRGYPDDWWAVPVVLSSSAAPGSQVRIVVLEPPTTIDGVVARAGADDPFSLEATGLVAVPGEMAAQVAAAAVLGNVVVLERP